MKLLLLKNIVKIEWNICHIEQLKLLTLHVYLLGCIPIFGKNVSVH